MKIFNIISKIEQVLEESPKSKFGANNRRVVDVELLYDMLGDLKVTIPEDIRRAGGVIAESEKTLRDANEQADEILTAAEQEADELTRQAQDAAEKVYNQAVEEYNALVSETSIFQEARARAAQTVAEAEEQAGIIMDNSKRYADDILADVQRYLYQYTKILNENREQLDAPPAPEPPKARRAAAPEPQPEPLRRNAGRGLAPAVEEDPYEKPVPRSRPAPAPEPEAEYYDDEYQTGETPKKRGWFKRMLEGDAEEEYEGDWDEEVAAEPPQKKRFKLFEHVSVEDDDGYDDEYDYE
ncbi:MAG: hypothetical protein FWE69_01645 [Clostridiales bacterium]|nr:hypothetical protein [Clostridiales bacterium]